jgi:hypothetical protein
MFICRLPFASVRGAIALLIIAGFEGVVLND